VSNLANPISGECTGSHGDDNFLYMAIPSANAIQKINLSSFTIDSSVTISQAYDVYLMEENLYVLAKNSSTEFKIYKLSAAHSEEVPEALRSVLIEFHYLPSFKEIFISEEERRKIMIEAYIDLVTRKIDNK
jgi:hypothetical protein